MRRIPLAQAVAPRKPVVLNHDPAKVEKAWREMREEIEADEEHYLTFRLYEEGLLT